MIVVISSWKKRLVQFLAVILIVLVFALAVPAVAGIFHEQIPVLGNWFKEEQPSGNPMRVENKEDAKNFDEVMDQFVIKLQNFYYEEKE